MFGPIKDLIDAFFGYWEAGNYEKTRAVSLEIKKEIQYFYPQDSYMHVWAEIYELIGLYLTDSSDLISFGISHESSTIASSLSSASSHTK